MNSSKYDREIGLMCPTCGGTLFEHDEAIDSDEQAVKCARCERQSTKSALIDENSENINAHIKDIGQEVVKDITKELNKTLKKLFK